MGLIVTPVYAAVLTALYLALSARVVLRRVAADVSLGDGNDAALMARIRAHGNFAEYVPLALVLMMLAEMGLAPIWGVHLVGICLTAGRLAHALALNGVRAGVLRPLGMVLTFSALGIGAVLALPVWG